MLKNLGVKKAAGLVRLKCPHCAKCLIRIITFLIRYQVDVNQNLANYLNLEMNFNEKTTGDAAYFGVSLFYSAGTAGETLELQRKSGGTPARAG